MSTNGSEIVVYTTRWCPACWQAKQVMKSMDVDYREIDITKDDGGLALVTRINQGNRSVPTIIFPDGSHLTEPRVNVLKTKLVDFTPK